MAMRHEGSSIEDGGDTRSYAARTRAGPKHPWWTGLSALAPKPPLNLCAELVGLTIRLHWTAADSPVPITAYRIYRADPAGHRVVVGETRSSKLDFFVDAAAASSARYSVAAVNPAGESAASLEVVPDICARMT